MTARLPSIWKPWQPDRWENCVAVTHRHTGEQVVVNEMRTQRMATRFMVQSVPKGVVDLAYAEGVRELNRGGYFRTQKAACDWVAVQALTGILYATPTAKPEPAERTVAGEVAS